MTISAHEYRGATTSARVREQVARNGYICGYPLWSEREDETLRRAYPNYAAARTALPHRTHAALKKRVQFLGIQKRIHIWTSADFVKLRRMYPAATKQDLLAAFPSHSFPAIEMAANRKHIWRTKRLLQKTGDALRDAIRGLTVFGSARLNVRRKPVLEVDCRRLRRDQGLFLSIFLCKLALGLMAFPGKPWFARTRGGLCTRRSLNGFRQEIRRTWFNCRRRRRQKNRRLGWDWFDEVTRCFPLPKPTHHSSLDDTSGQCG